MPNQREMLDTNKGQVRDLEDFRKLMNPTDEDNEEEDYGDEDRDKVDLLS